MLTSRVVSYARGSVMAPHRHDEASFIVVVAGSYSERIAGTETEHGPGHMLCYPAFATHSQRFGPAGARKLVFTPPASAAEFLEDHGLSLATARACQAPAIRQLASRALSELRNHDEFAPLALEGVLLELVSAFARGIRPDGPASPPHWVRAARALVCETAGRSVSLDALAAALGKHPVHLAREFRRYFGTSIGAFRRTLRVEQAAAMLLERSVGLSDVALACGFASHSHLCRSLKAAYGLTPSAFRTAHRGGVSPVATALTPAGKPPATPR
jgi:AraC family transcriptional regulator